MRFQEHNGALPPIIEGLVRGNDCLRYIVCRAMLYVSRVMSGSIGRQPDYTPSRGTRRRRRRWAGTGWTIVDVGRKHRKSPSQSQSRALAILAAHLAPEEPSSNDGLCGWNATRTPTAGAAYDQYSAWRASATDEDSANGNWNAMAINYNNNTAAAPVVYFGRKRAHRTATFVFRELSFDLFIRGAEEDGEAEFDLADVEETFPCWESFHGDAAATSQGRFEQYVCARYAEFLKVKESRRGGKFKVEDGMVEMDF